MRTKVLPVFLTVVIAVLLATTPAVSQAASLITGKQIKNNTITSKDVKDRSLLAKDFKAGQLPAGARGPQGVPGAAGAAGPQGAPGDPGLAGYEIVQVAEAQTSLFSQTATCPGTKKAIGGGHNWIAGLTDVWFWQSGPNGNGTGWVVRGNVDRGGSASTITAYAICANVG